MFTFAANDDEVDETVDDDDVSAELKDDDDVADDDWLDVEDALVWFMSTWPIPARTK